MSERIIKNVGSGLLAQLWTVLIGFIALPILVRGLGPERYGLLALSLALIGFAAIADLGVGRAASKFIAEDFEKNETHRTQRFISTALTLSVVSAIATSLVLLVVTPLLANRVFNISESLRPVAAKAFLLTAVGLLAVLLRILFDGVLAGHHRIALLNLTNMAANTLKVGFSVLVILQGQSLLSVIAVNVIVSYLHALALLLCTFRHFGSSVRMRFGWERSIARQLLQLGAVTTLSWVLGNVILLYADRFIISVFLPLAMTGYYTAAFDIVSKQWYISSSISQAFFPVFSGKAIISAEQLRTSYVQATKALSVVATGVAVMLAVFAKPLLTYWISPEFGDASSATMVVLSLGILLSCYVSIPYTAIIAASSRPSVSATFFGTAVLIHVFASIILLRHLEIVGVAIGFVLAYAFVFVASLLWVRHNVIAVPLSGLFRCCFLPSWISAMVVAVPCWLLLRPLVSSLLQTVCAFLLGYALYLGLCAMTTYSQTERRHALVIGLKVVGIRQHASASAAEGGR